MPPARQLVGLLLHDAGGVLRAHQKVHTAHGDGEITSGTFSPDARQVDRARAPAGGVALGDTVEVAVRDKRLAARVVKPPFVRNGKVLVASMRNDPISRSTISGEPHEHSRRTSSTPTATNGCAPKPTAP